MKTKFRFLNIIAMAVLITAAVSCSKDDKETAVTGVTIDKTTLSLKIGENMQLNATVLPSDAANTDVIWSASNDSIAAVSSMGKVTGLKEGIDTIKVTTKEGSFKAMCVVTVTAEVVVNTNKVVEISNEIKGNRTFSADSIYLLKGFVYVVDGAILTINAGTIIKGDKPTMGSLVVERGGKIMAEGTKEKPIIFTSNQPVNGRTYGDWGGIILCGKAQVNTMNGTLEPQVEGGPRTKYGGKTDDDNSGIMKYVRIEFAGYPFQPDKEINGLTFCAVGSATTIDYIQVSYCGDDSYEWFGGTVNAKHIIAFRGQDDEFDSDHGWSGKVQFALGIRDYRKGDISGSNGFESDNDGSGSTNTPYTSPVFSNVSLFGPLDTVSKKDVDANFKTGMHLRRSTKLKVFNSVIAGWYYGLLIDGSTTKANALASELVVKNCAIISCKDTFSTATGGLTLTETSNWFRNTMSGNVVYKTTKGNVQIFKAFALKDEKTAPQVYPSAGSVLLSGADFTDANLTDSFFDKTATFKGAVSPDNDWTAGWANWDPKNTEY